MIESINFRVIYKDEDLDNHYNYMSSLKTAKKQLVRIIDQITNESCDEINNFRQTW